MALEAAVEFAPPERRGVQRSRELIGVRLCASRHVLEPRGGQCSAIFAFLAGRRQPLKPFDGGGRTPAS